MMRLKASGASTFGKWPHAGDLLVAGARYEARELLILAGRGAGVILAAYDQHRQLHRRQAAGEIEIENAGRAAEIPRRGGGRHRVTDLLPTLRVLRLERVGEPA